MAPTRRNARGRDVVVIGTSAGGLEALDALIGQLPADLPASIFIVQHMPAHMTGEELLRRLNRHNAFQPKLAVHGERFKPGRIYVAPPNNHLLVKKDAVLVTKGARENRQRPAIDPLFRSAAVSHGPRVIGVVLTGMLDDGTGGLIAIKKCGGVTVVQDPKDAAYPGMPLSAIENAPVDFSVPVASMGPLLIELVAGPRNEAKAIPPDVRTEAMIAERVLSDVGQVNGLGEQVPYNCPSCGGVLWKMDASGRRYRCHTGHSFTPRALLTIQSEKIEEMLWISLRMFEERKNLLVTMASEASGSATRIATRRRAAETQVFIDRIREILLSPHSADPGAGIPGTETIRVKRTAKGSRRE